jgi:endonuclease YncB( thermonuclease family)
MSNRTSAFLGVMRGLDPRIHPLRKILPKKMDCRVKPGNDGAYSNSVHDRSLLAAVLCAVMFAAAASPAVADDCSFEPQGDGRVSAVIDARTFRMEDGREVRLAGIETGAGKAGGAAALSALVAGRDVTLHGENDAPDRYGRQQAFVFSDSAETSVQGRLLAQGEALVSGTVAHKACATELLAAEAAARRAKRGMWADKTVIKNAESAGELLARIGQFTVIEGKVLSVRQAGAVTYINFGRRWTRDFAVTISRRATATFEAAGVSPKSLENRRIRVRGFIEARGGPRIEARMTGQIEWAGEK